MSKHFVELPTGWVWSTLDAIGIVTSGGTPSTKNRLFFDGSIPWITPSDLSKNRGDYIGPSNRYLSEQGIVNSSAQILPIGSILYSSRATLGHPSISQEPLAISQGVKSITPIDSVDREYVFHYLNSHQKDLEIYAKGTTFLEISLTSFKNIPIPLPPFEEQVEISKQIAEFLSISNDIIYKLNGILQQISTYRKEIIDKSALGTITEKWRRSFQKRQFHSSSSFITSDSLNGEAYSFESLAQVVTYPDTWSIVQLGDLAQIKTGATPSRSNRLYYLNGTIPWIKSGELNNLNITEASEYITELALEETNAKIFPSGSLVMAMYGEGKTRGLISELKIDAATNQACAGIVFSEDFPRETIQFIKIFLQHNYHNIRKLAIGAVQPNLNLSIVRSTRIPIPPLEEQREILRIFEEINGELDDVTRAIEINLKVIEDLTDRFMKNIFQGELSKPKESLTSAAEILNRSKSEKQKILMEIKMLNNISISRSSQKYSGIIEALSEFDEPLSIEDLFALTHYSYENIDLFFKNITLLIDNKDIEEVLQNQEDNMERFFRILK